MGGETAADVATEAVKGTETVIATAGFGAGIDVVTATGTDDVVVNDDDDDDDEDEDEDDEDAGDEAGEEVATRCVCCNSASRLAIFA